jgi:hypothetical protein
MSFLCPISRASVALELIDEGVAVKSAHFHKFLHIRTLRWKESCLRQFKKKNKRRGGCQLKKPVADSSLLVLFIGAFWSSRCKVEKAPVSKRLKAVGNYLVSIPLDTQKGFCRATADHSAMEIQPPENMA